MSSSVGYYVSAADLEAQQQRELRAEIAALTARLARTRRRAAAANVQVSRRSNRKTAREGATSAELSADASVLRETVVREETELDRGLSDRLSQQIGRFGAVRSRTTDPVAELSRQRAMESKSDQYEIREQRRARAAVADAANLLATSAARCDPADLADLTRQVREMSTMEETDIEALRAESLAVASAINASVRRRKLTDRMEEQRARLLSLAVDALPAERPELLDAIRDAADPADCEDAVHRAVHRADLSRERNRVAAAAMSALAEAGCDFGPDFATMLIEREQAVVTLEGESDYGLLVRLPTEGGRLMAAVVRADDTPPTSKPTSMAAMTAQRDRDVAAQRSFCDNVLPTFASTLRGSGIDVRPEPFLILEPGRMPVPSAPPDSWSRPIGGRSEHPLHTRQVQRRRMELGHD